MPGLKVEAPPGPRIVVEPYSQAPSVASLSSERLRVRRASAPIAGARNEALLFLLAILAVAINGYHPFAEDAGIYVAGIKKAANPALFASSSAFITASSRMSVFSGLNAWIVRTPVARWLHLSLELQLFVMQIFTTWLLLYACWKLACLCFLETETRWSSTILVAVCLSVPVAGSSLFMLDPYLTARSFSTPLSLLAIAFCLERKLLPACLLVVLVALFHPLMSIYATGFVLLLWAARVCSWIGMAALIASALGAGAAIQYSQRNIIESPAYVAAVATRSYFFLAQWQWYELVGIAAPLLLLAVYCFWHLRKRVALGRSDSASSASVALAQACIAIGSTSIAVSLLLVHPQSRSHLIASMQPMRAFILIYLCMFLLLGGVLAELFLKRAAWRWVFLFAGTGAAIVFVQHQAFPHSAYLELPGTQNLNGWNQAFLWIRANTPVDAVFALDADYIHAPGEDAQGFRATAERDALADASKDGGAAAVFPQLADRWMAEHLAETGLNTLDDNERLRRLAPFHVDWIVLDRKSPTALHCPFEDNLVKVCRLR